MPWTKITRQQYQRSGLRYASDLTDAEWALIARKMPRRRALGRPRQVDLREVVQAIFYILSTGCQWRALPSEFPPYSTVQGYFYAWRDTGRWHRIVRALVRQARRKLGRKPTPTAAVIDSQSASTTQAGGARGFDPGKRVHGRKRHIVTDTNGLLLAVHVHPANVQDVHGAVPLLDRLRDRFPRLGFGISSPTASTAANNSSMHSPIADHGTSKSSNGRSASKASSSCPDDGSSNAPSLGSVAVAASPGTSKAPPQPKPPGFLSPTSGF
jgi:transposase